MLTTDNTSRFCSRCRLPLTDVASRECGVGPVCRRKDTHLYAKTIPANYAVAQALVMGMTATGEGWFHEESLSTWKAFYRSFMRLATKACSSTEGSTFSISGQDLRKVVTQLDFMCSYAHPNAKAREFLIRTVEHLGYVGLASVLSGEASTSKSKLWFENGRVHMQGLNNRSGWIAMGKIPGCTRPSRYTKSPYSAPAAQASDFIAATRRFWPLYEGSAENILGEAQAWVEAHPVVASQAATSTQAVNRFCATLRSQDFTCSFPWVRGANMAGLITQLKTIPAGDRSFDYATKSWSFLLVHLPAVLDMTRKSGIFGVVDTCTPPSSMAITPAGVYRSGAVARAQRTESARVAGRNATWFSGRRNLFR